MFYGRGAGKLPTASAVVADVMDAARHIKSLKYMAWGPGGDDVVASTDSLESAWYVRAAADADAVRVTFGDVNFLARAGAPAKETAFLTGPMTRAEVEKKLEGMERLSLFRVLD